MSGPGGDSAVAIARADDARGQQVMKSYLVSAALLADPHET